jgi:hypothetical protein
MMKMAHGLVWCLTCDAVLTTGSQEAQTALAEYLTRSETAITSSSYHGAPIPGRWCPNFAYRFKVASDWPTRPSPLAELAKLDLVSERGQDYDPLTIDLYIPVHPPTALVTRDKKTTDVHRQRTPKYSDACIPEPPREPPTELPCNLSLGLPPLAQPRHPPTPGGTNPYYPAHIDLTTDRRPFDLPLTARLYSPPAHIPVGRQP